jgi:hypothetical protein
MGGHSWVIPDDDNLTGGAENSTVFCYILGTGNVFFNWGLEINGRYFIISCAVK